MDTTGRDEVASAAEAVRARVLFLATAARSAVTGFLGLDQGSAPPPAVTPATLARFEPQWRHLLPDDEAARRAALVQLGVPGEAGGPAAAPADDADEMAAAEREFEWVGLSKGQPLVRQGEATDGMYLVVSGRLRVVVEGDGKELRVGTIGRGQTVGEMGLLTGEPRSASVYADRDSDLLRLSKEGWDRLLDRHPHLVMGITRQLVLRLREHHRGATRAPLNAIAVVPLAPEVAADRFAARLTAALARHGRALHLDRSCAGVQAGDELAHVEWLDEQELANDFVVYQAEPAATPWTLRCLRQADRILLLAPLARGPALTPLEDDPWIDVAAGDTPRDLVLLRAGGTTPSGTEAWLSRRAAAAHHHFVEEEPAAYRRLARQLVGRAVGLVLGGGGNRGLTHVGVIRALEEAGVPVDWVAGTSSGAIVAAQYAAGWDVPTLVERNRAWAREGKRMFDFTLPFVALIASVRLNRAFMGMYGDRRIEDLPMGFFCVSTNLSQGEPMIHRDGPLWEAVRASCSIPGLMPPVQHREGLLADGMLTDNLPIDVMSGFCNGGPVIAADISSRSEMGGPYNFGASVSTLEILLRRLNPFARDRLLAPSIVETVWRATEVPSLRTQTAQGARAALHLIPPVSHYGLFEMNAVDAMVEAGYACARERVGRWLEENAEKLAHLRDG